MIISINLTKPIFFILLISFLIVELIFMVSLILIITKLIGNTYDSSLDIVKSTTENTVNTINYLLKKNIDQDRFRLSLIAKTMKPFVLATVNYSDISNKNQVIYNPNSMYFKINSNSKINNLISINDIYNAYFKLNSNINLIKEFGNFNNNELSYFVKDNAYKNIYYYQKYFCIKYCKYYYLKGDNFVFDYISKNKQIEFKKDFLENKKQEINEIFLNLKNAFIYLKKGQDLDYVEYDIENYNDYNKFFDLKEYLSSDEMKDMLPIINSYLLGINSIINISNKVDKNINYNESQSRIERSLLFLSNGDLIIYPVQNLSKEGFNNLPFRNKKIYKTDKGSIDFKMYFSTFDFMYIQSKKEYNLKNTVFFSEPTLISNKSFITRSCIIVNNLSYSNDNVSNFSDEYYKKSHFVCLDSNYLSAINLLNSTKINSNLFKYYFIKTKEYLESYKLEKLVVDKYYNINQSININDKNQTIDYENIISELNLSFDYDLESFYSSNFNYNQYNFVPYDNKIFQEYEFSHKYSNSLEYINLNYFNNLKDNSKTENINEIDQLILKNQNFKSKSNGNLCDSIE